MLIFSNYFLYDFSRTFELQEKKRNWSDLVVGFFLIFRIIVWIIWSTVIGFGVRIIFFMAYVVKDYVV